MYKQEPRWILNQTCNFYFYSEYVESLNQKQINSWKRIHSKYCRNPQIRKRPLQNCLGNQSKRNLEFSFGQKSFHWSISVIKHSSCWTKLCQNVFCPLLCLGKRSENRNVLLEKSPGCWSNQIHCGRWTFAKICRRNH